MPWNPVRPNAEILAVHAAFINFDQILYFGGDQFDRGLANAGKFNATWLFDCNSFAVRRIVSPSFDAFCSGHSLAVGGKLVVAGGLYRYTEDVAGPHHVLHHYPGLRDAAVFVLDNGGASEHWTRIAPMNTGVNARMCGAGEDPNTHDCVYPEDFGKSGGRWYPTLLTLANSNILAMSGHPGVGDLYHENFIPEVFVPTPSAGGQWHRLGDFGNDGDKQKFLGNNVNHYPRLHLLPTGDIFSSTPIGMVRDPNEHLPEHPLPLIRGTKSMTINQGSWQADFHDICPFDLFPGRDPQPDDPFNLYSAWSATSVLLPLQWEREWSPRILVCGAETARILDLTGWDPARPPMPGQFQWKLTSPRQLAGDRRRMNLNAVILPTGEIFVSGGVEGKVEVDTLGHRYLNPLDSTAVREPEIYNPFTDSWQAVAEPAAIVRNYHSVALLMPDGRVWTAGSDRNAGPGVGSAELAIEVYEPWYFGNPNRPKILALPDHIMTGTQFDLQTTQAADIIRVAMVRCGSCTHAFNSDQSYITLKFNYVGGDTLRVEAPPHGNIAPSGLYFYYTINRQGLPSHGWRTYVSNPQQSEIEQRWDNLRDAP
jgi:hypothetical protein